MVPVASGDLEELFSQAVSSPLEWDQLPRDLKGLAEHWDSHKGLKVAGRRWQPFSCSLVLET